MSCHKANYLKMSQNKIAILGCGWLGLPLAKELITSHFTVSGSTTSENKLALLEASNINPFLLTLHENKVEGNVLNFLDNAAVLIIDIPPGLRKDASVSFVNKIKTLVTKIEKSTVKKVIFISSTSVYGDTFPIEETTEETHTNPSTESGKQVVEVEELLRKNTNFETTIIRFGGLVGPERNPSEFVLKKDIIDNPEAPINFIHQEDCIGIIKSIIIKGLDHDAVKNNDWKWNNTFNAVSPNHTNREIYYTQKAVEMNLKVPTFAKDFVSKGKRISSEKLQKILNYTFQKPI